MKRHVGGWIAAAILCVIAATVGLWSGPLAAASTGLHTSAQSAHLAATHSNSSATTHP